MNVILTIDKVDTAPQRALDCGPKNYSKKIYKHIVMYKNYIYTIKQ